MENNNYGEFNVPEALCRVLEYQYNSWTLDFDACDNSNSFACAIASPRCSELNQSLLTELKLSDLNGIINRKRYIDSYNISCMDDRYRVPLDALIRKGPLWTAEKVVVDSGDDNYIFYSN